MDFISDFLGSSLFQVGEDESEKKKSGIACLAVAWHAVHKEKRWNKTVVLNLNTEPQDERYRQIGFPLGRATKAFG